MTPLTLRHKAIYVTARLSHGGRELHLRDVIIDTGSWGSVFPFSALERIGVVQEESDAVETVRGIGGNEAVVLKTIDGLKVGDIHLHDVEIELGALDYGFPLDGILGLEFLIHTHAVVNFASMELRSGP